MRRPAPALTSFWPKSKTPISTTTRLRSRPDALKALQADSTELRDILKDYPDYKLTIEGHGDERGSAEYNVALGDRRAAPPRTTWSRSVSPPLNSTCSATAKKTRSARSTMKPAGSGIAASTSWPWLKHRNNSLGSLLGSAPSVVRHGLLSGPNFEAPAEQRRS